MDARNGFRPHHFGFPWLAINIMRFGRESFGEV